MRKAVVAAVVGGLRKMGDGSDILKKCVEIKRCETDADAIHADAVARLFREEKDPIAIIKWREIFEGIDSIRRVFAQPCGIACSSLTQEELPQPSCR